LYLQVLEGLAFLAGLDYLECLEGLVVQSLLVDQCRLANLEAPEDQ
jgi:hypothetical protein